MEQKINQLKTEIQELKQQLDQLKKSFNIISLYGATAARILLEQNADKFNKTAEQILIENAEANKKENENK